MLSDFRAMREMLFTVLIVVLALFISSDTGPEIATQSSTLCPAVVQAHLPAWRTQSAYYHQLTLNCLPSSP